MKAKVYFTRDITPEKVVELYNKLGVQLPGKVAVKVHSGEKGNQNYLHPEFWKPMVEAVHGTIVECNTAYGDASGGVRDNTDSHWKLLEEHDWTKYFDVDLMDADGALVGGAILPGPQMSLTALVKNTAQLPQVELDATPKKMLGANTADCLHSGIVHGTAAMLDGMVAQFRAALAAPEAPVIATGTLPPSVRAACVCGIDYRETLILDGLYQIWQRNARR